MLSLKFLTPFAVAAALGPSLGWASTLQHVGMPQALEQLVASQVDAEAEVRQGLELILPRGWKVEVAETAALPPTVSWKRTDTWASVLERMADRMTVPVQVNWGTRVVFVGNVPAIVDPGPAAAMAASAPVVADEPPAWEKVQPDVKKWNASANSGLRAVLQTWADRAGWQLQWDLSSDLELLATVELQGDFESAVRALLQGVRQAGGPDTRAGFYAGNRVLRIHTAAP